MQNNKSESFRTFVLQYTPSHLLDKTELKWITTLQTQINNKNPDNLNYEQQLFNSRKLLSFLKHNTPTTHTPQTKHFYTRNYTMANLSSQHNTPIT
jgi:hypothetical protein